MSMKNVQDIVDRLKGLQRYCCTTTWYDDPDMQDDDNGSYVYYYDLEKIVKELEEEL